MATSVDAKLLRATKFPPEFNQKVDMQKVNVEVMKKWIAGKIAEILGNEDDVVIELCFNLVEGERFVRQVKGLVIVLHANNRSSLTSRRCRSSSPDSSKKTQRPFAKSCGSYA
jgi:hypothetical protein